MPSWTIRMAKARAASPLRPTPYTKSFLADVRIPTDWPISLERSTARIFATWSRRYAVEVAAVLPGATARLTDAAPLSLRSEEHTSELQSRQYLVCRLLLEKKK